MTEWGIDTLFNPGKRHMDEEKRRLQSTREEIGDSSGGRRIDLESGVVRIARRQPAEDDDAELDDEAGDEAAEADDEVETQDEAETAGLDAEADGPDTDAATGDAEAAARATEATDKPS
jgi:hypothetical protein